MSVNPNTKRPREEGFFSTLATIEAPSTLNPNLDMVDISSFFNSICSPATSTPKLDPALPQVKAAIPSEDGFVLDEKDKALLDMFLQFINAEEGADNRELLNRMQKLNSEIKK